LTTHVAISPPEPAPSGAPADPIAPLHAAKTRQLYAGDWAAFSMWCRRHETEALPAAPGQVLAYLATLSGTGQPDGLGPGALARRVAAIGDRHRRHGHKPPGSDPAVRAWLRALRAARPAARDPAPPSRRAPPPSPAQLARRAAACPGDLAGLRDRALLLLLAAGLGADDLLGLDREHVRLTDTGAMHLLLGDPAPAGEPRRVLALQRSPRLAACPVRALQDWLHVSDCRFGPVFRAVDRWGNVGHRRLTADGLRRIGQGRTPARRHARRTPPGPA